MKSITRKEELILLSILSLKDNAYLIAITDYLSRVIGKKVSLTSVHLPLSRLERSLLIEADYGEATAVRGGRRKKIYRVTRLGLKGLKEHKRITDMLWADFQEMSIPED